MQVESSAPRLRAFEVSPQAFLRLARLTALALYLIVITGATVRLTGSGLGCEGWPGCEAGNYFPEKDYHAFIEFGNRGFGGITILATLVTWLASRRSPGLPLWARGVALAVFAGTLAQAPLGALTVSSGLHPLLVMPHLLLSIGVLGGAVLLALDPARPRRERLGGGTLHRQLGIALVAGCFGLIVSGAFVTAAGPHSGGEDVSRFGSFEPALVGHAASVAVFGAALMFSLGYVAARGPRRLLNALALLTGLVLLQMAIGELQYRTELPWWLVLVHVAVAAAVWIVAVVVSALFWRESDTAPGTGARPGGTLPTRTRDGAWHQDGEA